MKTIRTIPIASISENVRFADFARPLNETLANNTIEGHPPACIAFSIVRTTDPMKAGDYEPDQDETVLLCVVGAEAVETIRNAVTRVEDSAYADNPELKMTGFRFDSSTTLRVLRENLESAKLVASMTPVPTTKREEVVCLFIVRTHYAINALWRELGSPVRVSGERQGVGIPGQSLKPVVAMT